MAKHRKEEHNVQRYLREFRERLDDRSTITGRHRKPSMVFYNYWPPFDELKDGDLVVMPNEPLYTHYHTF